MSRVRKKILQAEISNYRGFSLFHALSEFPCLFCFWDVDHTVSSIWESFPFPASSTLVEQSHVVTQNLFMTTFQNHDSPLPHLIIPLNGLSLMYYLCICHNLFGWPSLWKQGSCLVILILQTNPFPVLCSKKYSLCWIILIYNNEIDLEHDQVQYMIIMCDGKRYESGEGC